MILFLSVNRLKNNRPFSTFFPECVLKMILYVQGNSFFLFVHSLGNHRELLFIFPLVSMELAIEFSQPVNDFRFSSLSKLSYS